MERLGRSSGDPSEPYLDMSHEPRYDTVIHRPAQSDEGERETERRVETAEPATISHSVIPPKSVHIATVHLPAAALSSSAQASSSAPGRGYTKRKDSRKSASRSPTDNEMTNFANIVTGDERQDSWATGGSPISGEWKPMETCIGPDGRTYIRDTSIVVIEHDHERNLEKVVERPKLSDSYQWFSFIGIICCVFMGAYSFKKSREVEKKFVAGDYEGSENASLSARKWATAAFVSGALIIIVFIFLLFVEPCPLARALLYDDLCPRGT